MEDNTKQNAYGCGGKQSKTGIADAHHNVVATACASIGFSESHEVFDQKHRGAGFAVRAVGSTNLNSTVQTGVLDVCAMNTASLVAAGGNGRPSVEFTASSRDVQTVLVVDDFNCLPGNLDGANRIHYGDTFERNLDFWPKQENPQNRCACNRQANASWQQAPVCACNQGSNAEGGNYANHYAHADGAAWSKGFFISHSSIITASEPKQSQFLAMKGEN